MKTVYPRLLELYRHTNIIKPSYLHLFLCITIFAVITIIIFVIPIIFLVQSFCYLHYSTNIFIYPLIKKIMNAIWLFDHG